MIIFIPKLLQLVIPLFSLVLYASLRDFMLVCRDGRGMAVDVVVAQRLTEGV